MTFVATPGLSLPGVDNTPQICDMGPLFSKEDQAIIDADWNEKNPNGNNGTVFAAEVFQNGRMIYIWKTSFAARQSRGKLIKGVYVPNFKTTNIASFGKTEDGEFVSGHHLRAKKDYPFAGILDGKDLAQHAKREILEESGLEARSLRIVGIVYDDKQRTINFVGLFDAPSREECERLFAQRSDPDQEMGHLVFYPMSVEGIKKVVSENDSWPYLEESLLAALNM
ncbi:hypothetical protein [Shimazuella kribbensis]|uniref:hypothetical protein n=1 Tax=Shimazuella kribbensis TaxID=139808 RepID=UPI0004059353|nr:hypothetical protein [Shimazuella kribbensis]